MRAAVSCAAGLLEYLANETPTSADAARDPGPDRYEPPEEGVLLQRGLIEPVSLEARLGSRPPAYFAQNITLCSGGASPVGATSALQCTLLHGQFHCIGSCSTGAVVVPVS